VRRIAIINQKGGVGKTTTTANIGAALARAGRTVLLVDLDPQAHLTLHVGVTLRDEQVSAYDVLTDGTPLEQSLISVGERLTLLPADVDLAGAEAELISVTGREAILREALTPVADRYDVILIDCPPALGVLTVNALVAAYEVIIPLQAHFFALQGLGKLLDTVTLVRQRINPPLRVTGIALTMHDATTKLASEVVDDLRRFLDSTRGAPVAWADARIYETAIRRNIKLAESSSYGQTIFDYALRSNGAVDYARLTAEIFGINPAAIVPIVDGAGEPPSAGKEKTWEAEPAKPDSPDAEESRAAVLPTDGDRFEAVLNETSPPVFSHAGAATP
jgi:chromosome partitioning protein